MEKAWALGVSSGVMCAVVEGQGGGLGGRTLRSSRVVWYEWMVPVFGALSSSSSELEEE